MDGNWVVENALGMNERAMGFLIERLGRWVSRGGGPAKIVDLNPDPSPRSSSHRQSVTTDFTLGTVEIRATGKDRYGRTLARVFVDGADVNLAMVKAGMAWRFDKYSKDGAFQTAQEGAQRARRGLWADPAPVAPWEWRKGGKAGR